MEQSLTATGDRVVKRRQPYRKFSLDQKMAIVRAALEPGTSVSRVARQFDVNANLVFRWKKMYGTGVTGLSASTGFVPVDVVEAVRGIKLPAIAIELGGSVCVRIEAGLDERGLSRVLAVVRKST